MYSTSNDPVPAYLSEPFFFFGHFPLTWFPITAAANDHKLSSLKQYRVILLLCKPEVQSQFHWPNIQVAVGLMFGG